jgi:hypothetical protein
MTSGLQSNGRAKSGAGARKGRTRAKSVLCGRPRPGSRSGADGVVQQVHKLGTAPSRGVLNFGFRAQCPRGDPGCSKDRSVRILAAVGPSLGLSGGGRAVIELGRIDASFPGLRPPRPGRRRHPRYAALLLDDRLGIREASRRTGRGAIRLPAPPRALEVEPSFSCDGGQSLGGGRWLLGVLERPSQGSRCRRNDQLSHLKLIAAARLGCALCPGG